MPDPLANPGSEGDTRLSPDRGPTSGTPRWVYVFGITAAIVLVLLFLAQHLFFGGGGPGAHAMP